MKQENSEKNPEKNPILNGIIWKEVLIFFVPILIGSFFQHLYTIVDTIIVGKYLGTLELSAVGGSASKLVILVTNFFIGVSSGITAYTSRYFGKKDYKTLNDVIYNGILMFLCFGILLSFLGISLSEFLLNLMNTPEDTMEFSLIYLNMYLGGIIFCILYNTFAGILRALGDSKRPLYVLIFCSFVNIFLDIVFILVLDMGVFGVALATIISQAISAFILVRLLLQSIEINNFKELSFSFKIMKEISLIGIPAGIQSIMFSLSNIVVQSGVNTFGARSVASWAAYLRIDSILDIFVSALGSTVIPFVGQNLGAGNIARVKQSIKQIILISYGIIGVLVFSFILLRVPLLSMFTNDAEVVYLGGQIMCIILPMYLLTIPQQMLSQALRGLGKSVIPMFLTLIGVVGLRFFWVYIIFPFNPTLQVLASCYPASALLMSIIFVCYYSNEIKKI